VEELELAQAPMLAAHYLDETDALAVELGPAQAPKWAEHFLHEGGAEDTDTAVPEEDGYHDDSNAADAQAEVNVVADTAAVEEPEDWVLWTSRRDPVGQTLEVHVSVSPNA
jgi:hypothetical protein